MDKSVLENRLISLNLQLSELQQTLSLLIWDVRSSDIDDPFKNLEI